MAGLDDGFVNPLDEFRETSMNLTNGSNLIHPSMTTEKNDDQSQSNSPSTSLSESSNKTGT